MNNFKTRKFSIFLFMFNFVVLSLLFIKFNKVEVFADQEVYIKFYEENGTTIDKSVTDEEIDVYIDMLDNNYGEDESDRITYESPIGVSKGSFDFDINSSDTGMTIEIIDGIGSIKLKSLPSSYKYNFSIDADYDGYNRKYVSKYTSGSDETGNYNGSVTLDNSGGKMKSLELQFIKKAGTSSTTSASVSEKEVTVNYYVKGTTSRVTDKYNNQINSLVLTKPLNEEYTAPIPADLNSKWKFENAEPSETITVKESNNIINMYYSELPTAVTLSSTNEGSGVYNNPFDVNEDDEEGFVDPFDDTYDDFDETDPFDDVTVPSNVNDDYNPFDDVDDDFGFGKDVPANKERVTITIDNRIRYAEYDEEKDYYVIYDEEDNPLGYSRDLVDPVEITPFSEGDDYSSENSKTNPKTADAKVLIPSIIVIAALSFVIINLSASKRKQQMR